MPRACAKRVDQLIVWYRYQVRYPINYCSRGLNVDCAGNFANPAEIVNRCWPSGTIGCAAHGIVAKLLGFIGRGMDLRFRVSMPCSTRARRMAIRVIVASSLADVQGFVRSSEPLRSLWCWSIASRRVCRWLAVMAVRVSHRCAAVDALRAAR
jgi:hypothetical protein